MPRRHKQPKIDPRVSDALRDHALIARWFEKPQGKLYARGFSQYDGLLSETFRLMQLNGQTEFPDYLLHMLRCAETFSVTPDMHALVEGLTRGSSARTIPPSLTLHDLPAPNGFVFLPSAIFSRDIDTVDYPIRGILWYTDDSRRFGRSAFIERRDGFSAEDVAPRGVRRRSVIPGLTDDDPIEEIDPEMPVISVALFNEPFKDDPLQAQLGTKMIPGPRLSLLHFAPFNLAYLHSAWNPVSQEGVDGRLPENMTESELLDYQYAARYMVLFWLIANQKIAATQHVAPGPITAMRAREAKVVPRVRVIALRRDRIHTEPDPDHVPGREYSHRWHVAAFWRHQACGPGRQDRRWVLVRAHIRGPDDKPLIVKERAYDLRR
jgi:hypothetical protein